MKPAMKPIPPIKKISNWLLGYFMWCIVYRSPLFKKIFYSIFNLFRKNEALIKKVQGQKLSLNPYRSIIELRLDVVGTYEPHICEYLIRHLAEGMTVIDIGANNGFFSLLAADLVGNSGQVLCFEPNPTTFELLQQNVSLNGYSNIICSQNAISNSAGVVRMSNGTNNALNSLAYSTDERSVDVEAETLDRSLDRYSINKCDLILMDIEGAEWLAIQGMERTLERNPNVEFVIELHKDLIEQLGGTVQKVLQFFNDYGFQLYKLNFWGQLKQITANGHDGKIEFIVCKRVGNRNYMNTREQSIGKEKQLSQVKSFVEH